MGVEIDVSEFSFAAFGTIYSYGIGFSLDSDFLGELEFKLKSS